MTSMLMSTLILTGTVNMTKPDILRKQDTFTIATTVSNDVKVFYFNDVFQFGLLKVQSGNFLEILCTYLDYSF